MTVILRSDTVVPEPYSLDLRGVQTDQFGTVLGGHRAILDPLQTGPLRALTGQDSLPNLVMGGAAAAVRSSWPDVVAAKGLNHDTSGRWVTLPPPFDLINLGAEPSFVLGAWITCGAPPSSYSLIAGTTYQTGGGSQWYIARVPTGMVRVGVRDANVEFAVPADTPMLITIALKRVAAGAFRAEIFLNAVKVGEVNRGYPFPNPADVYPQWGGPSWGSAPGTGFGTAFVGKLHRIQIAKINPATFDALDWIAEEIELNADRFKIAA